MAVNLSEKKLQEYMFPNFARLHFLIKLYPVRLFLRQVVQWVVTTKKPKYRAARCTLTDKFEEQSEHFKKNGWAFVEDIFPDDFHRQLVADWPPFYYFKPIRSIHKAYDGGFIDRVMTFDVHPSLSLLQEFLKSDEFVDRLCEFADSRARKRKVDHIAVCRAKWQSSCIPHLDSASEFIRNKGESVNIIFFVAGTGGPRGGGTCIMGDNEDDIVFEPTNLTNTGLIYKNDSIFHGFPAMRWGAYRWMISCQLQVAD